MRRLLAIAMVWLGCSLAWMVLGSTLLVRSGESSSRLGDDVFELWGPPMRQLPPRASSRPPLPATGVMTSTPSEPSEVPLTASDIDVSLSLEQRKKGLVWFPTYAVQFRGRYSFENTADESRRVDIEVPLQNENALYDGFEVTRAGGVPVAAEVKDGVARFSVELGAGKTASYDVQYRSRGTSRWQYDLTNGTGKVRDFRLSLRTDFDEVNFLPGTLSPTTHDATGDKWHGVWTFKTLVSSSAIGLELPQRLNPGPLASRITFFAPVSLLFFFFVVAILGQATDKRLHPLHFFFLGCSFFAFHLLFAYLVDHLAIGPSFAIASVVSVALTVSYARLFVGWKFALREMGLSQIVYLVLFSFTFFFSGFTGLSITIGAVLTLFVLMQITGRRDPDEADEPAKVKCAQPYRCSGAQS